jgi:tripartite motif-containing protein 71
MVSEVMYKMSKSDRVRAILLFRTAALVAVSLLTALFPVQARSAASSDIRSSSASETYVFVGAWDNAPLPGTFNDPHGVAVDSSGNVYVADTNNYRVQKFTSNGVFTTQWGERGWWTGGKFREANGIAVDANGNVYVADEWNGYIQKFTPDGIYLTSWQVSHPRSVAVDASGSVYVAGGGMVYKYDTSGNRVASWNAGPGGIAVDDLNGRVYVSDKQDDEISKFDLDGNLITTWTNYYDLEDGLAVDGSGNVYACHRNRIAKYDPNGEVLDEWGRYGSGDGQFKSPQGVAVGPDGSVYVVDTSNDRIQRLAPDGTFLAKWGITSTRSKLRHPEGVAIGGDGTVFVADTVADRVQSFTNQGVFLSTWDTVDYPSGVSTDASGYVYVSGPGVPDSGSRTVYGSPYGIRKYTSTGTEVAKWGACCSSDDGRTNWASGIAVGPEGNVYVADTNNDRIQKFTSDGTFLTKWGSSGGSGDGQLDWPEGVAVAPDGSVYVADTHNDRIQKFTSDGTFLTKWGSYGSGDGQFRHPKGIAVDSSGYVYVADAFNDRIQKFTLDGVFVTKWGSYGQGNSQFDTPLGVAVDSSGYVYVADANNNRIQKFERASPDLSSSAKFVDKNVAQPGDILNYTITLSNMGSLDAAGVLVTDTLPLSTTCNTGSLWASSGSYDQAGGVITWTGTMSVAEIVTITFSTTISAMVPKGTLIVNTASINDGVSPSFSRTATTIADPYQVHLPMTLKVWCP